MSLARLLLGATGSGGSFPHHPELGRWTRQGAVFTVPAWSSVGILEPTVIHAGTNDWRMWFRSGGLHSTGTNPNKVGYATSTDGVSWTDSGAAILGNGTGGEANRIICPHMRLFGSTWHLYYTDIDAVVMKCATSATGYSGFTVGGSIGLSLPTGCSQFGHINVWKEGSTYYALFDAYLTADDYWPTFYATSSSATSGWSIGNGGAQVTSLRIATDGTYGAAFVPPDNPKPDGTRYAVWYHASPVTGNLVSDLYRGVSTDRLTWTTQVILQRSGTDYETDQIADPCVVEVDGSSYLYYDADDAGTGVCVIKLATFNGTLATLIATSS